MLGPRRKSQLEYMQRNAAGEYIYVGDWYVYRGRSPRKRTLTVLWLLLGGSLGTLLLAGLLPAPGMTGRFYVILPEVFSLAACVSLIAFALTLGFAVMLFLLEGRRVHYQ